jgi:hypothetical protein
MSVCLSVWLALSLTARYHLSLQGAVRTVQNSLHSMESKVDTIRLVTIGRDNAEGLRSEYQRHAFATVAARASSQSAAVAVNAHSDLVTGTARVPLSLNLTTGGPRFRKSLSFQRAVSRATAATGRKLLSVPAAEDQAEDHASETQPKMGDAELLILLPTFIRRNLEDNTE